MTACLRNFQVETVIVAVLFSVFTIGSCVLDDTLSLIVISIVLLVCLLLDFYLWTPLFSKSASSQEVCLEIGRTSLVHFTLGIPSDAVRVYLYCNVYPAWLSGNVLLDGNSIEEIVFPFTYFFKKTYGPAFGKFCLFEKQEAVDFRIRLTENRHFSNGDKVLVRIVVLPAGSPGRIRPGPQPPPAPK